MKIPLKPTTFDYITILFFLILVIFFYLFYDKNINNEKFVEVYQDNTVVYQDNIDKEVVLKLKNAVVEVKNKKVRIKESNCPYKICEHTGWISEINQQIICVPNKIYIKIVPHKDALRKVDSITF